ncbi:MAG: InlB B-repeat-containing protein [Clostridia bacterium]|nr:InlB B-repeat-containing protein [Clostridia bacterium]
MKKLLAVILSLVMVMSFLPTMSLTAFAADDLQDTVTGVTLTDSDGDGYYEISSADELVAFANLVNGGNTSINGVLTADIYVNENLYDKITIYSNNYSEGYARVNTGATVVEWTAIGTNTNPYAGSFDGGNFKVSGLYSNTVSDNTSALNYVGLFGYVSGGSVKNVTVTDTYLSGQRWIGGIVGFAKNANISGCYFTESRLKNNSSYVGGIVGKAEGGTVISNCHNTATITAYSSTGGIAGGFQAAETTLGKITGCTNSGTVKGSGDVGGILGSAMFYVTVENCTNYESGTVNSSGGNSGGISGGLQYTCTINNCVNKADVTDTYTHRGYVGGIVGEMSYSGSIINSYNTGDIIGAYGYVGGVVGSAYTTGIEKCYNTGTVICTNTEAEHGHVGGVAGGMSQESTCISCYNTGNISGAYYIGGVAGSIAFSSEVSDCYSAGSVTGDNSVGGVIGRIGSSILENCTYDNVKYSGNTYGTAINTNTIENNLGYSTEDFTSGKVCYIMNGSTSEGELVWGQTLVSEATPTFTGRTVYYDEITDPQYWNDRPETKYTVSFAANGGEGTMNSVEVIARDSYTLPECGFTAPDGKEFKAWSVNSVEYAVGDSITIEGNVTVTAIWKDADVILYKVNFNAIDNGSVTADVVSAKVNATVTLNITPDTYYELDTITVTSDSGVVTVSGSGNTRTFVMPESNVTISATFKKIEYTVSFISNGGSGSMSSVTVEAGDEYTLPKSTFTAPANKLFKAWQIGENEYAVGAVVTITSATTLTAVWMDIPEAMWGASADSLTSGGTLNVALSKAASDSSIKYIQLQKNVRSSGNGFTASGGEYVLDLNNKSITVSSGVYNVAFDVGANATVTMKNGSVTATEDSYSDCLNVSGKLTLENVAMSGISEMAFGALICLSGTVDLSSYSDFTDITVGYLNKNATLILPKGYALMDGTTVVTAPEAWKKYTIGKAPTTFTVTVDGESVETDGYIILGIDNGDGTYSLPENVVGYYIDDAFVDAGKYTVVGGEVITTVDFNVTMVNGAQVRYGGGLDENGKISAGNGLRFLAQVDRSNFDGIGYGMKITAEGSTLETIVDAEKWQADETTFTVAITNMAVSNYNRNFTATPFVKVKYDDGTEKTVYGTETVTRSIYYVAAGLLKTGNNGIGIEDNYGAGVSYGLYDVLNAYINMVGVRLNLYASGNITVSDKYTGDVFFDVASVDNGDGSYTITVTPITQDFAYPVEIMSYWNEFVRINNNNSVVVKNISDSSVENGVLTFTFTLPSGN